MLKLEVSMGEDLFDDELQEFIPQDVVTIELEHSLFALSKWESKWEKPYMTATPKTPEETLGYIEAMCMTPNTPPEVFRHLSDAHIMQINTYVEAKMTATWFNDKKKSAPGRREVITAEVIYYWMISLEIPLEWEHRHLNSLITLIKVCSQKNAPATKMSKADMIAERNKLNAERQAQYKTSG